MKKFEIGKEYFDRSACNYDCIFTIKIIKRTEKTVTFERHGKTRRAKLFCDDRGEYIIPDRYSMAPVFRAECEVQPEEEAPAAEESTVSAPAEDVAPSIVRVIPVDSLVDLRPASAVVLTLQNVPRQVPVRVGGGPPANFKGGPAAHRLRDRDCGRGGGGAVPNDRVCAVRIRVIRYQDVRFDITKRANAPAAAVRSVPDQSAGGIDVADAARVGRIGIRQPPVSLLLTWEFRSVTSAFLSNSVLWAAAEALWVSMSFFVAVTTFGSMTKEIAPVLETSMCIAQSRSRLFRLQSVSVLEQFRKGIQIFALCIPRHVLFGRKVNIDPLLNDNIGHPQNE